MHGDAGWKNRRRNSKLSEQVNKSKLRSDNTGT